MGLRWREQVLAVAVIVDDSFGSAANGNGKQVSSLLVACPRVLHAVPRRMSKEERGDLSSLPSLLSPRASLLPSYQHCLCAAKRVVLIGLTLGLLMRAADGLTRVARAAVRRSERRLSARSASLRCTRGSPSRAPGSSPRMSQALGEF